jgi:hypothetical protein
MSRSRSLYCHSDTGPTGPTALVLREKIRSRLSRPFTKYQVYTGLAVLPCIAALPIIIVLGNNEDV